MLPTTVQCLASVAAFTQDYRLYLFDNVSSAATERCVRDFLETRHISHIYVKSSVNAGCIAPRNTLFSLAVEPYFVCLDNDVVVGDGWCNTLLQPLKDDPGVWQVGAIPVFGVLDNRMVGRKLSRRKEREKADYVEGWCFAVNRKRIMDEFGFLVDNANLDFFWGEDSDLSLRIHERGGKIVAVPAPVVHLRHRTHPLVDHVPHRRSEDYQERNLEYLVRRWTHGGTVRPSAEVTLDAPQVRTAGRRNHILVHRGGIAFGDLIMLTAMFRGLREQFPESEIYFWGRKEAQQILGNNPYIDRFLPIPYTRQNILALRRRFSQHYDLHFRKTLNTFEGDVVNAYELCCRHVGVTPSSYAPVFCPTAGDLSTAYSLLYDLDPALLWDGFILMHVETAPLRRLPDATAVEVANRLAQQGHNVVFVGLETDYAKRAEALGGCPPNVHFLQEVGHTYPMRTIFTIPIYARLLIAVDSSFSHAAGALGTPSVLAFGSMDSRLRATHFRNAHVLQKHVACGPCNQNAGKCLARPGEVAPCMQAFTADEIVEAALEVLKGNAPSQALRREDLEKRIVVPAEPPPCRSCSMGTTEGITRMKNCAFYQCRECKTILSHQVEELNDPGPVVIGDCLSNEDRQALAERAAQFMANCKSRKGRQTRFLYVHCKGSEPIWRWLPLDMDEVEIPTSACVRDEALTKALCEALGNIGPQTVGIFLDDVLNRSNNPRALIRMIREGVRNTPILGRLPIADFYQPGLFKRNCWHHFITPIAGQNRWVPSAKAFVQALRDAAFDCRIAGTPKSQEIVFYAT
jgi:ADP-heptose:LPS heptosyltransferase